MTDTHPQVDAAATRLARLATMGTVPGDRHYPWLAEDIVAVYLWAQAHTRPGPGTNTVAYPSLTETRAFLAEHRTAREAAWQTAGQEDED